MSKFNACGALAMSMLVIGCAQDQTTVENAGLGIASFTMTDTATKTSVVGLDEAGHEVARLDLVHGKFALTGIFKDDYPGQAEVDGRKMDVTIAGTQRFVYETAGYDSTLHMPAHPASEVELIAFLADPHVKTVLDRWQIGFEPNDVDSEAAYHVWSGTTSGSGLTWCGATCGTARTFTINTCGGGNAPYQASRVTRTSPYNEYFIDQNCPYGSGGQSNDWFGRKSCPTTGSGAQPSTCGTTGATAACKGCGGYPANAASGAIIQSLVGGGGVQWCYDDNGDNCYVWEDQCINESWTTPCDCASLLCGFEW